MTQVYQVMRKCGFDKGMLDQVEKKIREKEEVQRREGVTVGTLADDYDIEEDLERVQTLREQYDAALFSRVDRIQQLIQ